MMNYINRLQVTCTEPLLNQHTYGRNAVALCLMRNAPALTLRLGEKRKAVLRGGRANRRTMVKGDTMYSQSDDVIESY